MGPLEVHQPTPGSKSVFTRGYKNIFAKEEGLGLV